VFSTDKPQVESFGRWVIIRTRIDANNYLIDPGSGQPEPAHHSGSKLFERGEKAQADWLNEAGLWELGAVNSPGGFETALVYSSLYNEEVGPWDYKVGIDYETDITTPSNFYTGTFGIDAGAEGGSVRYSPDGKWLAIAGESSDGVTLTANTLAIWPVAADGTINPGEGVSLTTGGFALAMEWSPDGNYLAVVTGSNIYVYGWNKVTGQFNGSNFNTPPSLPAGGLTSVAWNSTSDYIFAGTKNNNPSGELFCAWPFSPVTGFGTKAAQHSNPPLSGTPPYITTDCVDLKLRPQDDVMAVVFNISGAGTNDRRMVTITWSGSAWGTYASGPPGEDCMPCSNWDGESVEWTPDGKFLFGIDSCDTLMAYEWVTDILILRDTIGGIFNFPSTPSVPPIRRGNQPSFDYLNGDYFSGLSISPILSDGLYYIATIFSWSVPQSTGFTDWELYRQYGGNQFEVTQFDPVTKKYKSTFPNQQIFPEEVGGSFIGQDGGIDFWPLLVTGASAALGGSSASEMPIDGGGV